MESIFENMEITLIAKGRDGNAVLYFDDVNSLITVSGLIRKLQAEGNSDREIVRMLRELKKQGYFCS